jgi:hypothetical protein
MNKEVRVGLCNLNRYAAASQLLLKKFIPSKGSVILASSRTNLGSAPATKANPQLRLSRGGSPLSARG